MPTYLSKNFTLEELIDSLTADKYNIKNIPDSQEIENLKKLAINILQPIRDKYNHSISVSSGFRCERLNKIIGGSKTSQHITGSAADIKCTYTSKAYLFNMIKNMIKDGEIKVGQLIWEYGSKSEPNWIHISLPYKKINNILFLYNR